MTQYGVYYIVQFALVLPCANVPIERVFSLANDMWNDAKTQLTTETLKSMLITTVPSSVTHEQIKSNNRQLSKTKQNKGQCHSFWYQSISHIRLPIGCHCQ